MWAIDREHTLGFNGVMILVLTTLFVTSLLWLAARYTLLPRFTFPKWTWKLLVTAGILLAPLYFFELIFEVRAKNSASAMETRQWYLLGMNENCGKRSSFGRRRFKKKCSESYRTGEMMNKAGQRFSILQYGNSSKFLCVIGQRYRNPEGRMWFKVNQIIPIEYETDFYGRITKNGFRDLAQCTKRQIL